MKRPEKMPFSTYKEKRALTNKAIKIYLRGRTIFNNGTLIGSTKNIK